MDINRVTNEKKLNLCRWYFRGKFKNIIPFIFYLISEFFLKNLKKIFKQFYLSFSVGFAFLPFVWLINTVWFFGEAFKKPVYEEQVAIKRCKYICKKILPHQMTQLKICNECLFVPIH